MFELDENELMKSMIAATEKGEPNLIIEVL